MNKAGWDGGRLRRFTKHELSLQGAASHGHSLVHTSDASANARNRCELAQEQELENCPFSCTLFLLAFALGSCVDAANIIASAKASKQSVSCPPSWKKSSTVSAYLSFLAFAFYVWTSLAFALHVWTRLRNPYLVWLRFISYGVPASMISFLSVVFDNSFKLSSGLFSSVLAGE